VIYVCVSALGDVGDSLITAVERQPDMVITGDAVAATVIVSDEGGGLGVQARENTRVWVPPPVICAVERILRAVPGVCQVHLTVLEMTSATLETGPVDAIVPLGVSSFDALALRADAQWHVHAARVPHTRCNLVSCHLELGGDTDVATVDLSVAEGVVLVSEALGFTDTARLAEYFRDVGHGNGEFAEVIVFADTVVAHSHHLMFWAAYDWRVIVLEGLAAIRSVAPEARSLVDPTPFWSAVTC
jgi:hypothetical protein